MSTNKKPKEGQSSKDNTLPRAGMDSAGKAPQTGRGLSESQAAGSRQSVERRTEPVDPDTSDDKNTSAGTKKKSGGSTNHGGFKWLGFDGAGDDPGPSGSSQPGTNSGNAQASSSSTDSSSSDDMPRAPPPQPPRDPPPRPLTVTYPLVAENDHGVLGINQAAAVENPGAVAPAPPLLSDFGLNSDSRPAAGTTGRPIFGSNNRRSLGRRPVLGSGPGSRIPITIADQPAPGAHQHPMRFDGCGHFCGNHVECEEFDLAACNYNANLKLRGRCPDCDGKKDVGSSLRRFGSWISRTARSITRRGRASVANVFDRDGSGTTGASGAAASSGGGGGGGGRGLGGGDGHSSRPLSRQTARELERQRRRSARGQTGSSVGAGGFDPTIQDDTESDKS
ncbi:hypothetical protein AA313_de0205348 [Arthrobotrys entomopaga]|nr:hypothetical protein AA313_de0205348 [Arthrobotrys entomopaga]